MSSGAAQKPNAACACGSGTKFKKCCGKGGGVGNASAGAAGASQLSSAQRTAEFNRLMDAAADASDAGDLARAAKLQARVRARVKAIAARLRTRGPPA